MHLRHDISLICRIYPAFVLYDWFISLGEEITAIWLFRKDRRLVVATLLYALSRYPSIVEAILIWRTVFPMSELVRCPLMLF